MVGIFVLHYEEKIANTEDLKAKSFHQVAGATVLEMRE